MQKKKVLISILSLLLIILTGTLFYLVNNYKPSFDPDEITNDNTYNEIDTNITYHYDEYHDKNEDYVAYLKFESGLLEFPVFQGRSNETYIATDWESMEYDIEGSIFMDFRSVYEGENRDQNLIIYGHYVYKDEQAKFGPLHELKNKDNYETNKFITLEFENEIRRYEVAYVYYCILVDNGNGEYLYTSDDMQFNLTSYDNDYFNIYMKAVNDNKFYDTGVEINSDDRFLTLQTCVKNHPELRLIVIAKEIENKPLSK